jgi:hypothetical protein
MVMGSFARELVKYHVISMGTAVLAFSVNGMLAVFALERGETGLIWLTAFCFGITATIAAQQTNKALKGIFVICAG